MSEDYIENHLFTPFHKLNKMPEQDMKELV